MDARPGRSGGAVFKSGSHREPPFEWQQFAENRPLEWYDYACIELRFVTLYGRSSFDCSRATMRRLLPITLIASGMLIWILSAFFGRQPITEVLAKKFTTAPDAFESLDSLIRADFHGAGCFAIGLEHIDDYRQSGGRWSRPSSYDSKFPTDEVLASVGLDQHRYDEYEAQLRRAGAEHVRHCASDTIMPVTSILVYGSGLAVSGCTGRVEKQSFMPKPTGTPGAGGDFVEIVPLQGRWYLIFECT